MPVHSKIPICTFTFSDNSLLTPQDDSQDQYICVPNIWLEFDHYHGRYGKKFISPILLLLLLVLQFQTLYLKNHKDFKSENVHTGWASRWDVQSHVKMFVNNLVYV